MASNVEHRGTEWGAPSDGPKTPPTQIDLDALEAKRIAKKPTPITRTEGTEEKA